MNNFNMIINSAIDFKKLMDDQNPLLNNLKTYLTHSVEIENRYGQYRYNVINASEAHTYLTSGLKYVVYKKIDNEEATSVVLSLTTLYKMFLILSINKQVHQLNTQQTILYNSVSKFFKVAPSLEIEHLSDVPIYDPPFYFKLIKPLAILLIPAFFVWKYTWSSAAETHYFGFTMFFIAILILMVMAFNQYTFIKNKPTKQNNYSPEVVMDFFETIIAR